MISSGGAFFAEEGFDQLHETLVLCQWSTTLSQRLGVYGLLLDLTMILLHIRAWCVRRVPGRAPVRPKLAPNIHCRRF